MDTEVRQPTGGVNVPAAKDGPSDGLPASEMVFRALRARIISGELAPGTRLVELAIAGSFGVSRTPVREALKRLAAETLVLNDPIRGVVVHSPDEAELEDVYLVREVLDGLAARLAAQRITPSALRRLRVVMESMATAAAEDRRDNIVTANARFHDVIYAAAGNQMLERLARELQEFSRRFSSLPTASPERIQHVVQEHLDILEALQDHDADRADQAARRHLSAAREYIERRQLQEFAEKVRRGQFP